MYLCVRTGHHLQVEHTGALADGVAGAALVESRGAAADVPQCHRALHLV